MNSVIRVLFFGLSGKMRLVFGVLFILTLISLGVVIYPRLESSITEINDNKLESFAGLIYEMTDTYMENSIKNYLTGIADKTEELIQYYYKQTEAGLLSRDEAWSRVRAIIKDPAYNQIGTEGYISVVDTKGYAAIHPKKEGEYLGEDQMIKEFIENPKDDYKGSYMWSNSETEQAREKVAAIRHFEPWDLLIWATSYKTDFKKQIDEVGLGKNIVSLKIGKEGAPFVLDSSGKVIFHKDLTLIEKDLSGETDFRGQPYIKNMIKNKNDGFISYTMGKKTDETKIIRAYYKYYPKWDWVIVASIPKSEVFSRLYTSRENSLWLVVIAFIVINIVVFFIIYLILKPVSYLKSITYRASQGDLSQRIEVISSDEIGEMSEQFNRLIDSFDRVLRRIKKSSTTLLDSVQGLSVSAQEISSTSNEQAAAVKEIVSTMEDSDTLAKSIAGKINDVTQIANKMREVVENGFSIIKQSLFKMDEIKNSNSETIIGVQALSDKIGSIWEIVNIINGIADQTKIIAFNAELEASAAGEAGKNFQIVATEIRRLADNTVSSTNEIKEKINEIQHSSDNLIISSEEGTSKIKEGWSLSSKLQQVFEDILHSSEISANSAGQIALSINQQVSAFEQILLTLKQISEGIDNFVSSTRATTTESEKLKEMADSLNGTVNEYITDERDLLNNEK